MEYSRAEAKERAFAKWIGVCNVILPSFTADLKGLNEKAIRHEGQSRTRYQPVR